MDKEKEIEQMIRDYYHYDEYIPSDDLQEAIRKGGYINIVNLYNANYRKIPEGAVVLTKEEYDGLCENAINGSFKKQEYIQQAIKNTEVRFAQEYTEWLMANTVRNPMQSFEKFLLTKGMGVYNG